MEFSKLRTDIGAAIDPPPILGRYELLGTIGTGGMATVYLARTAGEAGFQRLCAIKILHPHLTQQEGFVAMLLDEARIAARLHHPNIVPIIDLGTQDGLHYVAMEYIEGCSLSSLLKRRRDERPPRIIVPLLLDMLAGLEAAHSLVDDEGQAMNLVHRDVSPQNMLVGVDGNGRITDFGVARAEARIHMTRPGQIKGKYAYMAPEQVRAQAVDRRADVFSAGVVLWSALTGRKLFHAETEAATISNILELPVPPPSTIGLKPPPVFDDVALKALERDPDRRYATAQEMEAALQDAVLACGGGAARREIAAWVTDAFHVDLAARRAAIRDVAANRSAAAITPVGRASVAELPTFTPSGPSALSRSVAAARPIVPAVVSTPTEPPLQSSVAVMSDPTPSAYRNSRVLRVMVVATVVVAVALVLVLWLTAGSGEPVPHQIVMPTEAPVQAPPPTAAPPAVASPPAPAPTVATPTAARPAPAPAPPSATVTAPHPAAVPTHVVTGRPLVHATATKPARTPSTPPATPPPPEPRPNVPWDKDSPLPPP